MHAAESLLCYEALGFRPSVGELMPLDAGSQFLS